MASPQGLAQGFERRYFFDPSPGEWSAAEITQRALDWLGRNAKDGERFFLWVHYRDPHAPYIPPHPFKNRFDAGYREPYDGPLPEYFHYWPMDSRFQKSIPAGSSAEQLDREKEELKFGHSPKLTPRFVERAIALYDGEIAYTDDAIGKLFDGMRGLGCFDDVVTVVTADHGESLGEHSFYFDHGEFLYDTCLRVPLVFRAAGLAPRVVEDLAGTVDVAPTLLDLFGIEPLPGTRGRSLVPLIDGKGRKLPPRPYYAESGEPIFWQGNPRFAGRDADAPPDDPADRLRALSLPARLKVVLDPTAANGVAVYDVSADPAETTDRAGDAALRARTAEAEGVLERLQEFDLGAAPSELDEETRQRLEQAGYPAPARAARKGAASPKKKKP